MTSNGISPSDGTIGDLQNQIGAALTVLGDLLAQGRLPRQLEPLRHLVPPPGSTARIVLHCAAAGSDPAKLGRDIPDHAAAHSWQPRQGYAARVWYEVGHRPETHRDAEVVRKVPAITGVESRVISEPMRDLIRELDRAERGKPYVVLRWFLDTFLTGSRLPWSSEPAVRQRVLSDAIERGLVLTAKVDNPKNPERPSTTVRLDRARSEIAETLAAPDQMPQFKPVPVRGEPVSETIIRERR